MMTLLSRRGRSVALLAAALTLAAGVAEARVGGGRGSFGSRGARTYSAPPPTRTAPTQAAPIQRSQTPQAGPQTAAPGVQAAQPRRFGFGTGLAAGLFGAGLLGLFMGNGFLGGLSGLASMFGLLLQLALVAVAVMFLVRWFRRRQETPAYARASTNQPNRRSVMDAPQPQGSPAPSGLGSMLGGGLGQGLGGGLGGMGRGAPAGNPVHVGDADYAAFDKALQDVQSAYSRQDIAAIWDLATPEMAGYIQEELSDNTTRGVVNTVSDVRLESGDLAEAWSEGTREYATVAMRYSMIDVTKDKATGQVVDGDPAARTEATELWTFVRERGSPWKLSAIQQAQ